MTGAPRLILAAPHPAALAAARRAARRGGNAVDAALAAAAALTVVYPHQCSLGGDLIALVHSPGGTVRAVLSCRPGPPPRTSTSRHCAPRTRGCPRRGRRP